MNERRLYRLNDLVTLLGYGETWIREQIKAGRFPEGRKLVGNTRVWTDRMVETYLAALEFGILANEPPPEDGQSKRTRPEPE